MDIGIFTPHYEYFVRYAKKFMNETDLARDLVHDILTTLSEKDTVVNHPKSYFVRCIQLQVKDPHSKFFKTYRKHRYKSLSMEVVELDQFITDTTHSDTLQRKYLKKAPSLRLDLIESEWVIDTKITEFRQEIQLSKAINTLSGFDKAILKAVYSQQKTMKEVALNAGVPYRVITNRMEQIKQKIKDEIERVR